jgi:2-polyprenyl-3-methyl-5-hydroxy-6-metoxy-1,4-benzoquinol methylase
MDRFNHAYYKHWYENPKTRAYTPADKLKQARYVLAAFDQLGLPLRNVVDLGCGLGHWKQAFAQLAPKVHYTGVEVSAFACQRFGWVQSSVHAYTSRKPFDLVICQQVLQHLNNRDCAQALANMASYCRGALLLEVATKEDWDSDVLDKSRTEDHEHLRSTKWYRKQLAPYFTAVGGGLFLANSAEVPLFSLERI